MNQINFYLPESDESFARLPGSIGDYWDWQSQATGLFPYWGRYHWVLQTYLYLSDAGVRVRLTNRLPDAGVIVTHMDCVEYGLRPSSRQTLVIMLVDRDVPHPHAHLHITHNPVQILPFGMPYRYLPPWPQIGLIPRDPARGRRFEKIGYFGYGHNLDAAIANEAFMGRIAALGLQLVVPGPASWHDFAGIDAIVAIRKFGRGDSFLTKPSLKLLNAWLAGVPAILGHESAYRHEGRPGTGYLEATSPDELLACLATLKEDEARRNAIVAFGREESTRFTPEQTVGRWQRLIQSTIDPLQQRYSPGSLRRMGKVVAGLALERMLWRRPGRFLQSHGPAAG